MTLSSFLTNLVIPLNLCIALLLAAVVLFMVRLRKTAFVIAVAGLSWAMFWSLPASSLWAGGRLEQMHPYEQETNAPNAQAIVVLIEHKSKGSQNWFTPYEKETAIARTE